VDVKTLSILAGIGRGIGLTVAQHLLDADHQLLILDNDSTVLTNAKTQLGLGKKHHLHEVDLAHDFRPSDLARYLDSARFGAINLVNLASSRSTPDADDGEAHFLREIRTSAWAPYALTTGLMEIARDRAIPASVVNVSSPLASLVGNQTAAYHAGKAAMEALTRWFAVQGPLSGVDLTVNAVRPGFIVQKRHLARYLAEESRAWRELTSSYSPSRSVGSEDDVANAVCFLLNPASRYINGAVLSVDGGGTVQEQIFSMTRMSD